MASSVLFPPLEALDVLVPVWSVCSHLLITAIVLISRSLVQRSAYFKPANEFLCSTLWVVWTLEGVFLSHTRSSNLSLFILFVRLLVAPHIFLGAYSNPCSALCDCLKKKPGQEQVFKFFSNVGIQVAAAMCGMMYCNVLWNVFGSSVSHEHRDFLKVTFDSFLHTSIPGGFLVELLVTFAMFVPSLLFKRSFVLVVIEAAFVVFLVAIFSRFTGAFMNPMAALACNLAWHNHGLLEHVLVYWGGPIVGTTLSVVVGRLLNSHNHHHLHSE